MNPAALAAAFRGDLKNASIALTPGGIEHQEKEGQIEQSFKETLPIDTGRNTKEEFESLGFIFHSKADDIFWNCTFPKGWRKSATENSYWTDIVDETGNKRASIFYKAAFYDRRARVTIAE